MRLAVLAGPWLSLLVTSTEVQEPAPLTLDDPRKDLQIYARTGSVVLEKNRTVFTSEGPPNTIKRNSGGLLVSAKSMKGTRSLLKDRSFNLDSVVAEGDVSISIDSNTARAFQIANALPPTELPGVHTLLQSQQVDLHQTGKDYRVDLRQPFRLTDDRPGRNANGATVQASQATGVSGVLHFSSPTDGNTLTLQTADIQGPVHYHLLQTVHEAGQAQPTLEEYDVVGDHLTADLSKPEGSLVLEGHVRYSYSAAGATGTAERVVVTLDANGEITRLDASQPTANAQPKDRQP